jgi:hypothetical protein
VLCGTSKIPDDAAVKSAAVVVVLMLLAGCGAGSPGSGTSSSAPASVTSMCAKVSDDDVAKAFGVTGWHGRDVKGPGHDPSDVSCLFKGAGYEFAARTTVVSGAVASAEDALRVLVGIVPGRSIEEDGDRVAGVGDAALYSSDPTPPMPVDLYAVKRVGNGWRTLHLSALLAPVGSRQPLNLTKEAFVAFAQNIMAKL